MRANFRRYFASSRNFRVGSLTPVSPYRVRQVNFSPCSITSHLELAGTGPGSRILSNPLTTAVHPPENVPVQLYFRRRLNLVGGCCCFSLQSPWQSLWTLPPTNRPLRAYRPSKTICILQIYAASRIVTGPLTDTGCDYKIKGTAF